MSQKWRARIDKSLSVLDCFIDWYRELERHDEGPSLLGPVGDWEPDDHVVSLPPNGSTFLFQYIVIIFREQIKVVDAGRDLGADVSRMLFRSCFNPGGDLYSKGILALHIAHCT